MSTPQTLETQNAIVESSSGSWADAIPPAQGLYMGPEMEKDACGVGFIVDIKGRPSHQIVRDAKNILCNMTHRGATGAHINDGDGAGVMTSIPHDFFVQTLQHRWGITLPSPPNYATGNIYLNPNPQILGETKKSFEAFARELNLQVLAWRRVPRKSDILGPSSRSKEPVIEQPFIILTPAFKQKLLDQGKTEDEITKCFEKHLYILKKHSTHSITMRKWFYICSLSNHTIVYKGLLAPVQVYEYFDDLTNENFKVHFALVHSRFSTNTFPSWDRAQPMRLMAHNGMFLLCVHDRREINTLRGNKNWMRAREGIMKSGAFGEEIEKLYPIIEEYGSDSAAFDNVLELLVLNGVLTLPEAVMIMIPEAWQNNPYMDERKAFYQWAACLMEPWDGPALITFSDGRYVGASLDRNGLRPCRFYITSNDQMICASEVGTTFIPAETVVQKGRLQPGRMLLVDTVAGRVVDDEELKRISARKFPFGEWIEKNMLTMQSVQSRTTQLDGVQAEKLMMDSLDDKDIRSDVRLSAFGFTIEHLNMLIAPMVNDGKEALGSMGNDAPLACLSKQPRSIYEYFKQLFAQVTNPPIDPIREEIVMSLECYVGPEGNLLDIDQSQAAKLRLPHPILSPHDLHCIRSIPRFRSDWKVATIDITFAKEEGVAGYLECLERVCAEVSRAIVDGFKIVILSDKALNEDRVPISALIACGGVHHYLVRNKQRSKIALMVETGEAREVHHMCVLLGYGADAICPYLAMESMMKLYRENALKDTLNPTKVIKNYQKACGDGIKKVMSKMGISTLQSYKGAQIFEALGLDEGVVARCFAGTASRIKGVDFDILANDALDLHERAYPSRLVVDVKNIPEASDYHWRNGGESHINDPAAIANLQDAVRSKNQSAYEEYSRLTYEQIKACTLRGLLDFKFTEAKPIPIDQVEPWTEIVKRFCTGAMSYGSISYEAHSTLAIAMNRMGGKSNTGEGGEDPERSNRGPNGDTLRSAIKQVASGRFGVTAYYLADSDEIQIKMAQGAKPGEGGELPGHKVSQSIADTRKSTPGVGLISPPVHHDIYSIEDLKQLIYDLKCSNPTARVSVKLVSEVGVGVVASGVAKGKADHILIAGHDGGTGASRWTGIKHAGLPWELGLAETHQTLVLNDLRGRVVLQTDGQIRTGRDVVVACLLGAEEWGFATTPLIAMGCTMMRKCHLNTCPVGIATQDPHLRKKFEGQPEHVINFFYYVAEEVRSLMARLGFRTINEMVGRCEMLAVNEALRNPKTRNLDLSPILTPAYTLRPGVATYKVQEQDHRLQLRKDNKLIEEAKPSLEQGKPTKINMSVVNTDRAFSTTLSYEVAKRYGEKGLPENTIHIKIHGSVGQSFGAFLSPGITVELEGDANDYVGKGLSGGKIVVYPPRNSVFKAEENIIVGNVCLYGATSGKAFFNGIAAERFAVRNSGAIAVVEGVGDHGCEYMTGGRVVILGSTGRNFAAGMSGGIAYILDTDKLFERRCNKEMVFLETVNDPEEESFVRGLIEEHKYYTNSNVAAEILSHWNKYLPQIVKVYPKDYKAAVEKQRLASVAQKQAEISALDISPTPKPAKRHEANVADIEDSMVGESEMKRRAEVIDKVKGFMKYKRQTDHYRNPKKRVKDYKEINARLKPEELKVQAARCMDCGVPFCQSQTGCPIGNIIPKWNDLVFKDEWKDALDRLMMTNNFPEFTGRVCPAPCEGACVLGINEPPVSIKSIECAIIDRGFEEGWIKPTLPPFRTNKKIAIIGSGPAGLAAADQLNKAGHWVTVYDRNDRHGGLLMYGIPNMKLEKKVVQRRLDLMAAEGVKFVGNAHVGKNVDIKQLKVENDVVLLATGATWPRDLNIPNRNLNGIHYAMEFLSKNTKSLLDSDLNDGDYLSAKGKKVVVIGGGDTGTDCIATSLRHGAESIVNFELLPQPPSTRAADNPWPQFPRVFKVDYGHTEVQVMHGRDPRHYQVLSKEFVSDGKGNVKGINTIKVEWTKDDSSGRWIMKEMPGTEHFFPADLVLLAMGFLGPEKELLKDLSVTTDRRSNIQTAAGRYATSVPGVFAAGDCRRGQSLIVWAIREGREAAREIDQHLMGDTKLPYVSEFF
ncbi:hypothetical protein BKA69DRAFT_1027021 [Paraphysoderma sedebokerense]|nr:hypothetical protein BKA69DRAFT_1027021 [Paraphysoderma sedebokerense]